MDGPCPPRSGWKIDGLVCDPCIALHTEMGQGESLESKLLPKAEPYVVTNEQIPAACECVCKWLYVMCVAEQIWGVSGPGRRWVDVTWISPCQKLRKTLEDIKNVIYLIGKGFVKPLICRKNAGRWSLCLSLYCKKVRTIVLDNLWPTVIAALTTGLYYTRHSVLFIVIYIAPVSSSLCAWRENSLEVRRCNELKSIGPNRKNRYWSILILIPFLATHQPYWSGSSLNLILEGSGIISINAHY